MNYITDEHYRTLLKSIIQQVEESSWDPDYVFAIARGGLVPGTYLSHYFKVPCRCIQLSTRDFADCVIPTELFDILASGERILIVDDIADTGKTINLLVDLIDDLAVQSHTNVNWGVDVKFAVLQAKPKSSVKPNIVGEFVDNETWQVYPWEKL